MLLLTTSADTPPATVLERSLAFGTTAALVWELYEFTTFVTRSPERTTAYADTLGDLALGWLGALTAAVAVALVHRHEHVRGASMPPVRTIRTRAADVR